MTRRGRALTLYLGLAYGCTWLVWWPYVRAAATGAPAPNPFVFYLASLGPLVGAVVAEVYERGGRGVADLLARLVDLRRARWWTVVGLVSPLLLIPLAVLPLHLATGTWPAWSEVGVTGRAPGLGPVATWGLMTVSYGVGEEVGWRGFLLPRLQAQRSALSATLRLTVVWAAWHLPAFWFREGYVGLGITGVVGFLIGLAAGAIVLTTLYNVSGGSILVVALWHGTWNWVATADAFQGSWVATMTAVIMVAAPLLVWRLGARDLARRPRPIVVGATGPPSGGSAERGSP